MFNAARISRLFWILMLLVVTAGTVFAVLKAFEENLVFFYTPSQVLNGEAPKDRSIRIGGMVVENSLIRGENALDISFKIRDEENSKVRVVYSGVVPDLFKEGKGVVAQGKWIEGAFVSTEILAKHDEDYMPPELGYGKE